MSDLSFIVCPTCSAHNEPDSNFCDQCAEALHKTEYAGEEPTDVAWEPSMESLRWIAISLIVIAIITTGILFRPHSPWRKRLERSRGSTQDRQWIRWAYILDAEAITGQGMPDGFPLFDVTSFEGIHKLSFVDSSSRNVITVALSDSGPILSMNDVQAAWQTYANKVVSSQRENSDRADTANSMRIRVLGPKKLNLLSGEIDGEIVRVSLVRGGATTGMQVRLFMNKKSYCVLAYGTPFHEDALKRFLNAWQTVTPAQWQSSKLSPQQKSVAYTKRGIFLTKIAIRRLDALADYQKAVQLDPSNSDARYQLQSLTARKQKDDEALPHW